MKIGFYGDSYCHRKDAYDNIKNKWTTSWKTYIKQLEEHYSINITKLGNAGTGIQDTILLQFLPDFYNNTLPDVIIFCWSEPSRIFNRKYRGLNNAILEEELSEFFNDYPKELIKSAQDYYKYLYDDELCILQSSSIMYWFDNEILSKISKDKKIIHLWSLIDYNNYLNFDKFFIPFKNGVTFNKCIRDVVKTKPPFMYSSNHIHGHDSNKFMCDNLIYGIENYKNGKHMDYIGELIVPTLKNTII